MMRRQSRPMRAAPEWSRTKLRLLLVGTGLTALVLLAGAVLAVVYVVGGDREALPAGSDPAANGRTSNRDDATGGSASVEERRNALAARAMPAVDALAAEPAPVSTRDPGGPIMLPPAHELGPAGVPTGFPHTPAGALAQLAAIDQTALQSGTVAGGQAVIRSWALPGGPTVSGWSGVRALAEFLDTTQLAGTSQLSLVATPLMGQIKGSVGPDFVVPCVDFQIDVTVDRTARAAVADCQRMVWTGDRWMIGPGAEPAPAPSVWPGTDLAIGVGYRNLLQRPPR